MYVAASCLLVKAASHKYLEVIVGEDEGEIQSRDLEPSSRRLHIGQIG